MPVLLKSPVATGEPTVSGGAAPGSTLHCTQGSWAADMTASLLYRAPHGYSYQWAQGSGALPGATSSSLNTGDVGDYRCSVTATNAAGSATETSRPYGLFRVGKPKLNRTKGTATLAVWVPRGGILDLLGKGVHTQRAGRAQAASVVNGSSGVGKVSLLVKPVGRAKKRLKRTGKAKLRVRITYVPNGGTKSVQTRPLTLKKRILS
jgi:hypothetical protein